MSRLQACYVTHSPTGCAVTPSTWTWRVATSITNSTYSRLRNTVSTVKKSTANTPSACARARRHRSKVAGWTNKPCQAGRGSSRARPARRGRPSPFGVGPLGGGAPRPRAATPALPRSWSPTAAPAAPAIPAAGRGSDRAVVTPSTDHLRQRPRRGSSLEPTAGLSGTHTLLSGQALRLGLPPRQCGPRSAPRPPRATPTSPR
jgi:hypothetical protein